MASDGAVDTKMMDRTAFPIWLILICSAETTTVKAYDLSHLLKPQLGFEINLMVTGSSFHLTGCLPPALTQSMDYLMKHNVPFRLHYNSTGKWRVPEPVRSSRHAYNQVAHLVFVIVESRDHVLNLGEVFVHCTFAHAFQVSSTTPKDFIQVIADDSALQESSWDSLLRLNVAAFVLRLYFIILQWSAGTQFRSPHTRLVRETCGCDGGPSQTLLYDVFTVINGRDGMHSLAGLIRAEKRNFGGRHLVICAGRTVYATWKEWRGAMLDYSFRLAHTDAAHAYAGLLHSFHTVHNFTFDTVDCPKEGGGPRERPEGKIHTRVTYACQNPYAWCHVSPMVLHGFASYCTVSFSKSVQPGSFKLFTLAAPFAADPMAQLLLMVSCICMALTLMKARGHYWNAIETLLAVFSGLVGKSQTLNGNSLHMLLYATWLLVIGFISMSYTKVLQSIVVVPSTQPNDRSFDEMIRQNYTFATDEYKFFKYRSIFMSAQYRAASGGGKRFKMVEMQEMLAERIVERNLTTPSDIHSLVQEFSEGHNKAFIVARVALESLGLFLPSKGGWQLVVGAEEFFNDPNWWYFGNVERGSLLAQSLERFKQAGIVPYFLKLRDSKHLATERTAAISYKSNSTEHVIAQELVGAEWRVTIVDALCLELLRQQRGGNYGNNNNTKFGNQEIQ